MAELISVSPAALAKNWGEFGPKIQILADVSDGRLSAGDIVHAITNGLMQLWCVRFARETNVMLTEVLKHPQSREVAIISATGADAKVWRDAWPQFEKWARSEKCDRVVMRCREGWARVLADLDFNKKAIVLEKRLA